MPKSKLYSTVRTEIHCERHEVYFSKAYRQKSINDGLIVFLTRESHRGTNGVHGKNGDKLNRQLKRLAEKAWTSYYNKTKEEFIDDGRTIYDMDVDGMPHRRIKNKSGIYLTKAEKKAAILGALSHYMPLLFGFILSFGLAMILIYLWLR